MKTFQDSLLSFLKKEIPFCMCNLNQLQDLTTEIIENLLANATQIGKGATSIVYKVKNINTNKGYLCLKILNDDVIRKTSVDDNKKDKEYTKKRD